MNRQQIQSALRTFLAGAGGGLIAWAAARGYIGKGTVEFLTGETFIGIVSFLIPLLWGILNKTPTSMVEQVRQLSEVKGVVTVPTPEGVKLATAIPGDDVVPAGTAQAADLAEAPRVGR